MAKRGIQKPRESGKLRIGDMWNAITIIATSQTNPLKAVAEFVENSIDAKARRITITRGRDKGRPYLQIKDDGEGIPRDARGLPDFHYVATHICDSLKRELKSRGATGIQGEFGIGLLSFWTVGETLTLTSAGTDGATYQMRMVRGDPGYTVGKRRFLFPERGVELTVMPLLPGIRQLSGEKIQWYLSSELRDRIRQSAVKIMVVDHQAHGQFTVTPRRFSGRLLHDLPAVLAAGVGEAYVELYLAEPAPENKVALCRGGTRVLDSIAHLDRFAREPWTSGCLEGILDAPFLKLTPSTRDSVLRDEAFAAFASAVAPLEAELEKRIREQREAEEQRAGKETLRSVQRALREALLDLPAEEYDWFDVHAGAGRGGSVRTQAAGRAAARAPEADRPPADEPEQRDFFEFPGPLFSARVSPASCIVPVQTSRNLRALARDKSGRRVERDLAFSWRISDGGGELSAGDGEYATFTAPAEPGLTALEVAVRQNEVECRGEGLITVTDSLAPEKSGDRARKGLPGYTFHRAPGEAWRSQYDPERNLVVINNGHRDFVYASRNKARRLRYIFRLFAKELVLHNFPGVSPSDLLERMVELSLHAEERLH